MKYQNPILPGMHPDPSICRVGEDYYLVTSSFEYFPGIPVFHSKDLIHWKQIGHCIERKSQLTLKKGMPSSTGIYAPTIRHHNGIFYVVCTNVAFGGETEGNFFVWTKNPFEKNAWSEPIHLDTPGIDPSFYFEEDRDHPENFHTFYTGSADQRIFLCEIDLKTGNSITPPKTIWTGTGCTCPEGPHLYKKDGMYYLMIAEGGTELAHMVTIAKSKEIFGPYESYEKNPILSNRGKDTEIKAVGHADLIKDHKGNWWAVCLGIRCISYPFRHNLGRETMLMPVVWEKDCFPVLATDGTLEVSYEAPSFCTEETADIPESLLAGSPHYYDDFKETSFNPSWNYIYEPQPTLFHTGNGLEITSNGNSLNSADGSSFLGRRQEHHCFKAVTKLTLPLKEDGEEAGLTIYLNHMHHYEIALTRIKNENLIISRRQIGSLSSITHKVPIFGNQVTFLLEGSKEDYSFSYSLNGTDFLLFDKGETAYLTTEVGGKFTGNYIGLYAVSHDPEHTCTALFDFFEYQADA